MILIMFRLKSQGLSLGGASMWGTLHCHLADCQKAICGSINPRFRKPGGPPGFRSSEAEQNGDMGQKPGTDCEAPNSWQIDLVGGWATPLKNRKVNWDDEIPNISGKITLMATKPPTR